MPGKLLRAIGASRIGWSRVALGVSVVIGAVAASIVAPAPALSSCVGDCDGSGDVAVNELITMVNIALGSAPLSACAAGDADDNGYIEINEIIAGVNNALCGCDQGCAPAPPTPTPLALEEVTLTDEQIESAVTVALKGVADPWGADFGRVVERALAELHVRLGSPVNVHPQVLPNAAALDSLAARDCLRQYCSDARYCGGPSNSVTAPGPPLFDLLQYPPVGSCLNVACFQHDLSSFQRCVSGAQDPFGHPTGKADCYFSEQSDVVDGPLFDACGFSPSLDDSCGKLNNSELLVCKIARALKNRWSCSDLPIPPCKADACKNEPCPNGSCDPSTGKCGPTPTATRTAATPTHTPTPTRSMSPTITPTAAQGSGCFQKYAADVSGCAQYFGTDYWKCLSYLNCLSAAADASLQCVLNSSPGSGSLDQAMCVLGCVTTFGPCINGCTTDEDNVCPCARACFEPLSGCLSRCEQIGTHVLAEDETARSVWPSEAIFRPEECDVATFDRHHRWNGTV